MNYRVKSLRLILSRTFSLFITFRLLCRFGPFRSFFIISFFILGFLIFVIYIVSRFPDSDFGHLDHAVEKLFVVPDTQVLSRKLASIFFDALVANEGIERLASVQDEGLGVVLVCLEVKELGAELLDNQLVLFRQVVHALHHGFDHVVEHDRVKEEHEVGQIEQVANNLGLRRIVSRKDSTVDNYGNSDTEGHVETPESTLVSFNFPQVVGLDLEDGVALFSS